MSSRDVPWPDAMGEVQLLLGWLVEWEDAAGALVRFESSIRCDPMNLEAHLQNA